MKKTQIFPMSPCFLVAKMFLEMVLFLDTYFVLKTPGCLLVRCLEKRLGFGPARTFTLSMISYFQNCSILKFIFYSHDTWNLYAQIYFNSNTNVRIYLLPIRKINNIPGRSSHRKTWLLIHNLQKL